MNLAQYLRNYIRVTFVDNQEIEGFCNAFTNKLETEDELYDETTIATDKHKYIGFNGSEVKTIEVINK